MNPTAQLLEPEVRELIAEGRLGELREILHELPLADVADIFAELGAEQAAVGFRVLQRDDAGEVFSYLAPAKQEELIDRLGAEASLRVVEAMSPDDRVRLLDELPSEVAQRLVASLSPENRRQTQAILGYAPESVGRLMTPDFVSSRPDWTIQRVLEEIRRKGRDAETINVLYVVDDQGRLIDDIRLRQLLLADPAQPVESIMNRQFVSLRADEDQEQAVRMMSRYDRIALPVVDTRGVLLGIVTADDVADVAEMEVTEDIQKQGGVQALDATYLETGLREMLKKRAVWLCVLLVFQILTISVLSFFEGQLAKAAVLVLFIPMILSSGGNTGTQAASLLIRSFALGEVRLKDWRRVAGRELLVGLCLGSLLGVMSVVVVRVLALLGVADPAQAGAVGFTVGTAIVGVVIWGVMVGSMSPFVIKRLGLDPAAVSSPFIATLMDVSGMAIYFSVAAVTLRGTLL